MTDFEISRCLERLERYADWLKGDADGVQRQVCILTHQRPFETRAAAALKDARSVLAEALNEIDQAIANFEAKPVAA